MIDFTKPVQTRDGDSVEIIKTDGRHPFQIVGYLKGYNWPVAWSVDGSYRGDGRTSRKDLINVPEPVELWVNVYPQEENRAMPCSRSHNSRLGADEFAGNSRIALLRIWRDGTGWHVEEVK